MGLKKALGSVSIRNWMILAGLFISIYINKASHLLFRWTMFACFLPLAVYGAIRQVRSREYSGTPMLRVMLFSVAWSACSTLINHRVNENWILGFWFILFCWLYLPFAPKSATREELKREVFSLAMLLVCAQLVLSLLALYSIFSGKVVYLPRFGKIGIQQAGAFGEPIVILAHYNTEGRFAWYCILLAIYGILSHKNKFLRAFLIFAIVVNCMILAHSQSRTSYIGLAAALGLMGFRAVLQQFRQKSWRGAAALLAAAVAFALVLGGLNLVYKADITVARALKADQQTAAAAESGSEVISRVETDGQFAMFSNGRGDIWRETLSFLKTHPKYLLTGIGGTSSDSYDVIIKEKTSVAMYAKYHNSYLAALAIGGIPMLAAILAFLCLMIRPCWRVFFRPETAENAGLFIIPLFVFTQLLTCVPEEGIFLEASYSNLLFYFMCGIVLHDAFLSRQSDLKSGSR